MQDILFQAIVPGLFVGFVNGVVGQNLTRLDMAEAVRTAPIGTAHRETALGLLDARLSHWDRMILVIICVFSAGIVLLVYAAIVSRKLRGDSQLALTASAVVDVLRNKDAAEPNEGETPKETPLERVARQPVTLPESKVEKFLRKMDAKIKDNAIEPTVSGILTHVQTKTVKMEQSAKEVFLDEVISLLRKAGSRRYSYGPVAVLTFLAFRNDNIYLASDAVATFKSRTKAYEMIKDGKNRIAKDIIGRCGLPSGSPEEKKLEAGVKMANENLAASAIGRYFCECGAPKIYPEIEAAILDGQLSIAMEKVEGTPITDSLLNPRINIDEAEFREIVKRVCDGAKNKENYLGVSSLMCGSQFRVLCIPEEPIDFSDKNEKYKDSDNIMFYSADKEDSKYNFTLASDITEEPFLMPMQEYAIQILNSSLCGNVNMKGGYDVQFLFRPFRDGDFVVFGSWFRMEKEGPKKFLKYRMPYFPGEFAGKILRSASWLQLLDWLVNYWDRETSSNTILTGGNELHSIDFDGCCGDWDRMKPSNLPIVVDSEMFAVIKNLDPEKIKDIALSSGMSQENAELTERRAAALKSHAEDLKKDGKVISPDKWGEQTADAYAHTFSNSMFGCRAFGSNFPEKLRDFTENRDKLAPRAEAETEGELCVRKFAGEFAKLREKW